MSANPSLIGAQIGPYIIEAFIGSGGMAVVYRGFDTQLQRPVAVKVLAPALAPALATDPDYERRFRREARLVAGLRHPNIAQVFALGEYEGAPYMVQELLPGPTLEQRLHELAAAGQLMPQDDALVLLTQLAAALDASHAVGVIHRDIKPGNAIYNAAGEIALTDFGIARSPDDAEEGATEPGMIVGTPTYIAPEQALGARLTPAADVYALSVLAYQLLTGQVPFEAPTPVGVLHKHLYEQPRRPSELRPGLSSAVDEVILRGLAKEPLQRYQSAGGLVEALRTVWLSPFVTQLLPRQTHARPSPAFAAGPPRPRWALLLPLLLVALLAAGALLSLARSSADTTRDPSSTGAAAAEYQPFGTSGQPTPTRGPDGPPMASAGGAIPGPISTAIAAAHTATSEAASRRETAAAVASGPPATAPSAVPVLRTATTGSGPARRTTVPAPTAAPPGSPARETPVPASATNPVPGGPAPANPPAGPGPASPLPAPRTAPPTAAPPTSAPPGTVPRTAVPPTAVPPTAVPPTAVPPTAVPPTAVPPTAVPPTAVPPTAIPPTEVPPTEVPPTAIPPTEVPPTEVPPTAIPPTEVPPTPVPPPAVPGPDVNSYPLADLREVIASAVADGRAGEAGEELSALADQLTDAIAAGNRREAREALRELSKLVNKARDLDPAFADEVAALLDAVASTYDLRGN